MFPKKDRDYPYIPILFGWDWNPQSYSREGSGLLGFNESKFIGCFPVHAGAHQGSYPCDTSDAVRLNMFQTPGGWKRQDKTKILMHFETIFWVPLGSKMSPLGSKTIKLAAKALKSRRWKMKVSFGMTYFQGWAVSFWKCIDHVFSTAVKLGVFPS